MQCWNHLEKEAVATCDLCGRALCSDCAAEVEGRFVCRTVCEQALSMRVLAEARSQRATMAFVQAVIALLALGGALGSFGMLFKEDITTQNSWLDEAGDWHVGPQITRKISRFERACYAFGGIALLGCGACGLISAVRSPHQGRSP